AKKRALLVIQALVVEASRRGHLVKATKVEADRYGYRRHESKDDFSITVDRHAVGVELRQNVVRVPHEATKEELRRAERDTWYAIPKFDSRPADRLTVQLSGPYEHRQSKWSDSATHRLEDCLAQVPQEVELRGAAAEQARLDAIEAAAARRRRWESAMEQARLEHRGTALERELDRQVNDWRRAKQVRSYLAAMEAIVEGMDSSDASEATEWLEWATRRVAAVDPLQGRLRMLIVAEPSAEDLKQFLRGWSPCGP
ncbi:MAG: hypothetical protein ACRDZ5_05055, partial [Acidimicrobiales bacterium]